MSAVVQRYVVACPGALTRLRPEEDGDLVKFADVEEALRDKDRLAWLLPVISGDDEHVANQRTRALAAGLVLGLQGIALVDHAMKVCVK